MKKQIRKGVFETNSSSTHTICISKNHDVSQLKLPNSISFNHDEFGWECETYRSVRKKASYLYEAILGTYRDDNAEEKLNRIRCMLKKHGIDCFFEPNSDDLFDGYIDHVGEGQMPEWLENMINDDDVLLTYLFGDAFVTTGNDDSDDFKDIMNEYLGEESTPYGTFSRYGGYKKIYDNYDIYYK